MKKILVIMSAVLLLVMWGCGKKVNENLTVNTPYSTVYSGISGKSNSKFVYYKINEQSVEKIKPSTSEYGKNKFSIQTYPRFTDYTIKISESKDDFTSGKNVTVKRSNFILGLNYFKSNYSSACSKFNIKNTLKNKKFKQGINKFEGPEKSTITVTVDRDYVMSTQLELSGLPEDENNIPIVNVLIQTTHGSIPDIHASLKSVTNSETQQSKVTSNELIYTSLDSIFSIYAEKD